MTRLRNLRTERRRRGLSLEQLSHELLHQQGFFISSKSLGFYELVKIDLKLTTVLELADFFGVSVEYLAGMTTQRNINYAVQYQLRSKPIATKQAGGELDLALAQATTKYGLNDLQARGLKQELLANLWFQAKWFTRRECRTYDTTDFQ